MRNLIIIFILTTIIYSCNSDRNDREPLKRYIQGENRTCDRIKAEKFSTVDSLLEDFYSNSGYKDSFELNLRLGTFYYFKKNYDSSLSYYLKSKEIDSSHAKLYFDLALTYCELNEFEKALKSINTSLGMCGDNWADLNTKCYILGSLGRCEEAIPLGLTSLQMNQENEKIYGNLVICFDKLGQKDSVKKYIDLAVVKFNMIPERATKLKQKYNYH